jgi:hypothetical protein
MKYLWQVVRKLEEKDELDEEEMRDLEVKPFIRNEVTSP